jgi:hypothetical protein
VKSATTPHRSSDRDAGEYGMIGFINAVALSTGVHAGVDFSFMRKHEQTATVGAAAVK